MLEHFNLHNGKFEAMLDNYLKFDVNIKPFALKIYLNIDQFESAGMDLNKNVRHNHSNFEMQYFVEGDGMIEIGSNVIPVSQNGLCLVSPGEYHYQSMNEKTIQRYCIRFDYMIVDKTVNVSEVPWCAKIIKALSESPYLYIDDACNLYDYFENIKVELINKELLYTEKVRNILSDIFIETFRLIISKLNGHSISGRDAVKDDLVLDLFFEEIYWIPSLTAEDMANHIGISVRHLNRLLKKYFNLTFRQKLTDTRIEVSKGFLKRTDHSIEEISEKTGFSSVEYFYKCFKHKTGVPPGEYRKSWKDHF